MLVMSPMEALFVLFETPSHPLHVGALELFDPPAEAGVDHARTMFEALTSQEESSQLFRKRAIRPLRGVGYPWWSVDDRLDLGYHVRHSAVPGAGRMDDLLSLVSQMHGIPLDPQHPMWEMHVIEGLADGRTAVYSKIHLSLMDGPAGLRLLHHALSSEPDDTNCPAPWTPGVAAKSQRTSPFPVAAVRAGWRAATSLVGVVPAAAKATMDGLREQHLTLPLQSPHTMLNVPVGRARKVAARSWPIRRLLAVASAARTTIDTVVLAMCSGALRSYLLENYALPDAPLTAMLPVPLDLGGPAIGPRGRDHGVGAMVVGLATDERNPAARLARITDAMEHTHKVFGALSHNQFQLMSALAISPILLEPVRRFVDDTPPPFNVMISYMPGPSRPRYWNGARLDAVYPVPTILGGQALSITVTSRAGQLDVGVVGDRHAVPHLQRIITHLETSLSDLESAVAASGT
ncbi:wax ester/triacylglycerol synthase family O-acyltransferase [Rhodococcus oxybenzonivorans]|uniref:Diacylglycerol O-acyltransferase n=1 Tax=Rhodococcus oxybenzonivorans TaxID=1990687 RepID=A0A2S2C469_9NOCA|nr:wax ester/triacylglycerol synthase family O-acyltransferase [Rhodococcus oxybenzonivorans]AWK75568.1 wax ester/triacylglycerol synthase family O-acyltransferase [Rhodococcus oxybenzonivorans]